MSNKKRISRKSKQIEASSFRRKFKIAVLQMMTFIEVAKRAKIESQKNIKNKYPLGGFIISDDSKEKISDRRGNIKHVGVIGTAEINSYFELNNGTKIKCSEMAENLYRMTEPKKLEGMSALEIDKMGNVRTVFAGSRVHQQKK